MLISQILSNLVDLKSQIKVSVTLTSVTGSQSGVNTGDFAVQNVAVCGDFNAKFLIVRKSR